MATNTYVALDKVTLGSNAASATFSSIPSTYTDLQIVVSGYMATGSGAFIALQYNGDTGSNYSATDLQGNGSVANSTRFTSQTSALIGAFYSSQANILVSVQNYSNATTYKTSLSRSNASSNNVRADVGIWRSTAAITSVTVLAQSDLFAAGTTFSLYGIKAEPAWAAKATGGTITSDVQYTYHTFTSSGTFTPLQALSCDALVVAGGGSGSAGNDAGLYGGGGGAGGYRTAAGLSVTATAYTVTVGAGGSATTASNVTGNKGTDSVFSTITASGGGGGQAYNGTGGNANGGSGGGSNKPTGFGTGNAGGYSPVEGYAGNGALDADAAGGGGGSSAAGGAGGSTNGGTGGAGTTSSFSGTSVVYAAGGGGGASTTRGAGGSGIGGNGTKSNTTVATAGAVNTGSGGGGGARSGTTYNTSGAGGSGIVVIRYAN